MHIFGKVQGVCYRQSAQEKAKSLNLNGWVKNLSDGSVLSEAEGSLENIQSFISWCKQGPRNARVDTVDINWLAEDDKTDTSEREMMLGFKITG